MGYLNMKNNIKFFAFADERKGVTINNTFWSFFILPLLPPISYCILKALLEKIVKGININSAVNAFIIVITAILGIVWAIKYHNAPKGVFVYDDYFQIETHFFLKHYLVPFNPKIYYNEIKNISRENKKSNNYAEWNEKHLYFIAGYYSDTDSFIRIETKYGRIYCFCLEQQEEFLQEINKRECTGDGPCVQ